MPASNTLVTLDHAKHWAKRLCKAQPSTTLAQAQKSVAIMLGHASWHALAQFYGEAESTVAEPAEDQTPGPGTETINDPLFAPLVALINTRYPGLNAAMVEVLAIENDEIEGGIDAIELRKRELEEEGYYPEDALGKAVEEMTVTIHAPPGHSMIRVRDGQNKATLVLVSKEDYQKAMPRPEAKKKTGA